MKNTKKKPVKPETRVIPPKDTITLEEYKQAQAKREAVEFVGDLEWTT